MSDTASSLAITEKISHRPGGCVGIFFQLFDWNRRFAKKKLFPKKLLLPVLGRAKQASKKYGADDKLPKIRVIADENTGGLPNVKKNGTRFLNSEQNHGTLSPNLVARLMGLESMPAVQQDKLKKASCSELGRGRGDNHLGGCDKEYGNLENVGTKLELRPHKLQKTGPSDRRSVTRFGAEALQFKNVLSRSRKDHPRLASPVKSSKSLSGRNATRLIGAATKILEPGLQSRNRAKCALTDSSKQHHTHTDEFMAEAIAGPPEVILQGSNYYVDTARPRGQSSCRSCGNMLDVVDSRPNIEEKPGVSVSSISNYGNPSSQELEGSRPRSPMSFEQEKERFFLQDQDFAAHTAQVRDNVQPPADTISDRMPLHSGGKTQWQLRSQQCKSQKDSPSSICYNHMISRQNQVMGRIPSQSKLINLQSNRVILAANAINDSKNFVALNQSSSSRMRSRVSVKEDNFRYDVQRKLINRQDDSLPSIRKRSVNEVRRGEVSDFVRSTCDKERVIKCNAVTEKMMRRNIESSIHNCNESRSANLGFKKTAGISNKNNDITLYTFSSPMNQTGHIPAELKKKRNLDDSNYNHSPQKNSVTDKVDGNKCIQKSFPLTGDALGALLEQKLKELTSQEENEVALGGTPTKRTSAIILQELISALTTDQKNVAFKQNERSDSSYEGHDSNINSNLKSQAKVKKTGAPIGYSHGNDNLSPGSVLEASFSNESCFSSSLDDSSVTEHKLGPDFMDCSREEPQQLELDAQLLDSATSLSEGDKFNHAREVILNAELVFKNSVQHNSNGAKHFSISRFVVDELLTQESVMLTDPSCFLGLEDTSGYLIKEFLFDSAIEYLDSRYSPQTKCGFRTWTKQPLCTNSNMLIHEVVEEVRGWTLMAGLILDEVIEKEMSCGLGKWTDFEIEAFETGIWIDGNIIQFLVDEILIELLES